MISSIRIIGSLVYRTREALRNNSDFISGLDNYEFKSECFDNGTFLLQYLPGTVNEISNALLSLDDPETQIKIPAICNIMPVEQHISINNNLLICNLSIVGRTGSNWTTEKRDRQDFSCLLRPVYQEFINQIKRYPYFQKDYETERKVCEIFTTSQEKGILINKYGDLVDAIEIQSLQLNLKELCQKDIDIINNENFLLTKNSK